MDVSRNRIIEESDCSICGQCITHCPTGALRERDDTVKDFPRAGRSGNHYGSAGGPGRESRLGRGPGYAGLYMATEGRMVAALKKIGFDYVFDTNFSADLTIMEEGNELLARLADPEEKRWPMFTSCCPAWVRFMKSQYPEMADHLSTAKSPQQMFGAVTKSYFAEKKRGGSGKICSISIMPCVSKKWRPYFRICTAREEAQMWILYLQPVNSQDLSGQSISRRRCSRKRRFDSPLGRVQEQALFSA